MSADAPTEAAVRRAWHLAWNEGRVEDLRALMAPGYRRLNADGAGGQGAEEFTSSILTVRRAFPDLQTDILDLVRAGDRMALRWRSTGTHSGTMLGVPPTGRTVTVSGATFSAIEDGLITTEHVTWDPRALLSALGVIRVGQYT
ncbi:ester cyclase [Nocardiopsis composta]|uniref:Steroid delta-isomerase-like uncharacterized protein n=1 Tax=Nocardiopsis composta TaxID=157465 RepID=A0A7W8QJX0_9ACTN|nr:ester cyclase [Nocardiopsis composta]MBB5430866.1 steroid delta-isomerase-like uncharacterized protein [Nocardiopsis composta]